MSITVEVRPVYTEVIINIVDTSIEINNTEVPTTVELSTGIPHLKWGSVIGDISNQTDLQAALDNKLDKTTEIQNLEAVAALPAIPDPDTIYFITS